MNHIQGCNLKLFEFAINTNISECLFYDFLEECLPGTQNTASSGKLKEQFT